MLFPLGFTKDVFIEILEHLLRGTSGTSFHVRWFGVLNLTCKDAHTAILAVTRTVDPEECDRFADVARFQELLYLDELGRMGVSNAHQKLWDIVFDDINEANPGLFDFFDLNLMIRFGVDGELMSVVSTYFPCSPPKFVVPYSFGALSAKKVCLTGMGISKLPDSFCFLKTDSLDLQRNNLTVLPEGIDTMNFTGNVILSENPLLEIPLFGSIRGHLIVRGCDFDRYALEGYPEDIVNGDILINNR